MLGHGLSNSSTIVEISKILFPTGRCWRQSDPYVLVEEKVACNDHTAKT